VGRDRVVAGWTRAGSRGSSHPAGERRGPRLAPSGLCPYHFFNTEVAKFAACARGAATRPARTPACPKPDPPQTRPAPKPDPAKPALNPIGLTLASAHGTATDTSATTRSLVSLLGEQRAAIVEYLRRGEDATVAELAGELGIFEVAIRRHLGVLEDEDLVVARTERRAAAEPSAAKPRRGRPAAHYVLTESASRLFPQSYDRFAAEVLDFLADTHGRDGLRAFLRWRLRREVSGLKEAVTAEDLHGRLEQLATALSDAGFGASVASDGDTFTLTQDHCAIYDVAKEHPEVCAFEAATFSQVLGGDVTLSRRETLAGGYNACVCCVTPKTSAATQTTSTTPQPGIRPAASTTQPSKSHDPGRGDEL